MSSDTLTFTSEERQQLVAVRDMLVRRREAHDSHDAIIDAIVSIEFALKKGCPHNPEGHMLRDIRYGWEVTCPACEASWREFDDTALWDKREPR